MNSVPNSDSEQCTESKTGLGAPCADPEPRMRAHGTCTAPRPVCLLSLLCACSGCCVPAQPSMCLNTTEHTVCMLILLFAIIQLILLCACSAFYVPQYSRAYYVPAQPSMCHNTAEPIVCLLSLRSQYNFLYCDTLSQPSSHCCHHTMPCITKQFSPSQHFISFKIQ